MKVKKKAEEILDSVVRDNWKISETEALPAELERQIAELKKKTVFSSVGPAEELDKAYGIRWDYSDPASRPVRIGLAKDFKDPVPASDKGERGSSPFDSCMPWAGMGVSYFENGEEIWEDVANEEGNDVMVYIPEFWYYAEKNEEEKTWTWAISPKHLKGFKVHPGSGKFVGRYHTSQAAGKLFSAARSKPLTDTSFTDFCRMSREKGEGWTSMNIETWSAIQLLYLVEFADFNAKECLGRGSKSADWEPIETGGTDRFAYNTVKASGTSNMYRWIEDPFSNVFDSIEGIRAENGFLYIEGDEESVPVTGACWGWISGFKYCEKTPWLLLPDSTRDEKDNSIGDFTAVYSSTTSAYVARVGGPCNDDGSYGFFYLDANSGASYTSAYSGSRLLYNP